jgi:fatty-acid desaturase
MDTMLGQLQQLNLIAEQIVQLSSLGHAFGYKYCNKRATMGNVFAARIH